MWIRLTLTVGTLLIVPAMLTAQGHDHDHATATDPAAGGGAVAMGGPIVQTRHLRLTALRPPNAADSVRGAEILRAMRKGTEKYEDYRKALDDGFRIFLPNVPLKVYHFTNYRRAIREGRSFDPTEPSSLLYERRPDGGYTLVGAMYVARRDASPDELHARIPLSLAQWHAHVNICVPSRRARERWRETVGGQPKFGPAGTISTRDECARENGRFLPQLFGWMVHVSLEHGFAGEGSGSHTH